MTDGTGGLIVRRVRVRVVAGPDRGREALLEAGTLLIGTHPDNDLVLRDPTVGKYHLELALVAAGIRVRDLGGEGCTLIGGVRAGTVVVPPGTDIVLGRTTLHLLAADFNVPLTLSERSSFGPVLGRTLPMRQVFTLLERIAPTDAPVLLEGEPGCGRTLMAKAIHAASRFAASPLMIVDFTAPPSERPSLQQLAQRTDTFTLLIEHIDQAPPSCTAELLNLYERREEGVLDARIIATAAPGLKTQPGDPRSRRDLLTYVTAVRIAVPPLRLRIDDIPLLVRQFVREVCGVDLHFEDRDFQPLLTRDYPNNVRELRQMVMQALAIEPGPRAKLPRDGLARARAALVQPLNARPKPPDPQVARQRLLDAFTRDWVERLLVQCHGDLDEVARQVNMSRAELRKQLKKWGIGPAKAPSQGDPSSVRPTKRAGK